MDNLGIFYLFSNTFTIFAIKNLVMGKFIEILFHEKKPATLLVCNFFSFLY